MHTGGLQIEMVRNEDEVRLKNLAKKLIDCYYTSIDISLKLDRPNKKKRSKFVALLECCGN